MNSKQRRKARRVKGAIWIDTERLPNVTRVEFNEFMRYSYVGIYSPNQN